MAKRDARDLETRRDEGPSLVWFRNDLRLADNPALDAARSRGAPVLCAFVLEDDNGLRALGGASRWWLHHALAALADSLAAIGGRLDLYAGESRKLIPALVEAAGAGALFFNRRYGGSAGELDEAIKKSADCSVETFNGRLLREPWEVSTKQGGRYSVYTPYWKAAQAVGDPGDPLPKPRKLVGAGYPRDAPKRAKLAELGLLPTKPDWAAGFGEIWTPGEAGAHDKLMRFLKNDLEDYATERNILASDGTSRLSPHLRFGEISPRTILAEVNAAKEKTTAKSAATYLAEIGWREFDYHVLHYHPDVADTCLHSKFEKMRWRKPPQSELDAWQHGLTGFPVVDAGMRELWQTGYMHNRVRMITASFLIKDMLCDWRVGERWFWDCLCDADPANNTMNWQWVAGCGADASPFFRIFNPVTQGQKFDPDGDYVRRWVPELAKLAGKIIHAPWEADAATLDKAGVVLGRTYPRPILDHKESRQRALDAYEKVK